jgi:hypothetical protein
VSYVHTPAATELSIYHQRRIENAVKKMAELRSLKVGHLDARDLLMWLTRMEAVAQDLTHVIKLTGLAAELERIEREAAGNA